jgi:hypothetical protein
LLDFLRANRSRIEQVGFVWHEDQPVLQSSQIQVPEWLKEK